MRVHHVALSVSDLHKSSSFYVTHFGFTPVKNFERPDLGGKAVFLTLGNFILELWEFKNKIKNRDDLSSLQTLGIRHIAFAVQDIHKAREMLMTKGFTVSDVKKGASGGDYVFLSDPDGIQIELYKE